MYLGGGTPSLFPPDFILSLRECLATNGFDLSDLKEFTIEINPGTLGISSLERYLRLGINRFSVGAQTFHDELLKKVGRKHSAAETRDTLRLLNDHRVNYTFDLLFGLPHQTLEQLQQDLSELTHFSPPHLSAYCLTVPEAHPLNQLRPSDEIEAEMYGLIESTLSEAGIYRYEISSYARPGFESKHNSLYWNDVSYWGLGMGAHSYMKEWGPWGTRFSNPPTLESYAHSLDRAWPPQKAHSRYETLKAHEALTDFFHVSFRKMSGLNLEVFKEKFGEPVLSFVQPHLDQLKDRGLMDKSPLGYQLTKQGKLLPNLVFEELTFLEIPPEYLDKRS